MRYKNKVELEDNIDIPGTSSKELGAGLDKSALRNIDSDAP